MNGTYQVEPYHDEHFIIPAIKRFRIEHRIHHAQDTHPLGSVARAQLFRGGGGQSHHWSSFVLHAEDCKSNIWGVIIIRENFFLVQSTPSYNEILFKFVVGLLFCEWINKKKKRFSTHVWMEKEGDQGRWVKRCWRWLSLLQIAVLFLSLPLSLSL